MENSIEIKGEKKEFLSKYFNYIETIRHNSVTDKTKLKNLTGVAWPTLEKALKDFSWNSSPIVITNNGFILNRDFSMHAGISIGATQIKLFICDFCFNTLPEEYFEKNKLQKFYNSLKSDDIRIQRDKRITESYFCYEREDSIDGIVSRLKKIFENLIEMDANGFGLLSIGISFPGIISSDNLRIDFSPNIKCLRNVYVRDLISSDLWTKLKKQNISVSFEHDTQAASIFEKEELYKGKYNKDYSRAKNICCVYVAAGIGASAIINNNLCRGRTNSFGELGHTPAPELFVDKLPDKYLTEKEKQDKLSYEKLDKEMEADSETNNLVDDEQDNKGKIFPCECGKLACLESAFRRNVFDSYDLDNYLEKINDTDELKEFHSVHPYRYRVLKEYIGYMVGLIINFLNPDLIIFSGRIMWEIPQIKYDLNTIRANSAIGIPASNCDIILGSEKIYSAAAGTAISSYYCCKANEDFCEIYW